MYIFFEIVGLSSHNPTLSPLIQNLGDLSLWASLSEVVFRYGAFLLNPLKFDGIASSYFYIAPYHMHDNCTMA
jgi:hypothetical protein